VYATITQDTYSEEWTALNFLYWLQNKQSSVPDTCITSPAVITKDNVAAATQGGATSGVSSIPTTNQEYLWVAANVAHPFYAEGKAGWDAAGKALGVKAQLVGPVTADVQQQITIIEQAIAKSRKNGAMSLPPVTLTLTDGKLNVAVPDVAEGDTGGEVWLFGLVKAATITIGRGENKGRTVTYHNVVRRWIKLGDWSGKANVWSIPMQKLRGDGIDEAAVVVQSGTAEKPKAILGGTLAAIH